MNRAVLLVALVALLLLVTRKTLNKKQSTKMDSITESEVRNALAKIRDEYGYDTARTIERMYRIETNHFKSGQFKATGSAGMEKHRETFPYGWRTMETVWSERPDLAPVGAYTIKEGKGLMSDNPKVKTFLKFPSVYAAMVALAVYLRKYPAGRWYAGTDKIRAAAYERALEKIKSRFV